MAWYVPGQILIVDYPFTVPPGSKRRSGLVLFDAANADCVFARITSAAPKFAGDVALEDWQLEGLALPSTVRLLKMATLSSVLVRRTAGELSARDAAAIAAELRARLRHSWPQVSGDVDSA